MMGGTLLLLAIFGPTAGQASENLEGAARSRILRVEQRVTDREGLASSRRSVDSHGEAQRLHAMDAERQELDLDRRRRQEIETEIEAFKRRQFEELSRLELMRLLAVNEADWQTADSLQRRIVLLKQVQARKLRRFRLAIWRREEERRRGELEKPKNAPLPQKDRFLPSLLLHPPLGGIRQTGPVHAW